MGAHARGPSPDLRGRRSSRRPITHTATRSASLSKTGARLLLNQVTGLPGQDGPSPQHEGVGTGR